MYKDKQSSTSVVHHFSIRYGLAGELAPSMTVSLNKSSYILYFRKENVVPTTTNSDGCGLFWFIQLGTMSGSLFNLNSKSIQNTL